MLHDMKQLHNHKKTFTRFVIRIFGLLECFCDYHSYLGIIISIYLFFPMVPMLIYSWFDHVIKPVKKGIMTLIYQNKLPLIRIFQKKAHQDIQNKTHWTIMILIYILIYSNTLLKKNDFLTINGVLKEKMSRIVNSLEIKNKKSLICVGLDSLSLNQARLHFEIDFSVSHCTFFRSTQYSGEGGVIYVFGGSYAMNISYSMFFYCSCNSHGGAICFSSTNSSIKYICASKCYCRAADNYYGQFAFITATISINVEYLSLSNCSYTFSGEAPLRIDKGNQRVDNTNSSMNYAFEVSGIGIWCPSSLASSYCTYSNNKVSNGFCVYLYTNFGTISYTNIVHNNSPVGGVVVNDGGGSPKFYYCIFDMNQNTLFCVASGGLEVSHSFISLTGALSGSIAVSIANNNSLSKKQTYQVQFFNSFYCNTDIPLRTIEGTIGETPKETLQRTYEDCSEFYHTSDMKELSSIFSFQFLNQILILLIA